MKDLKNHIIYLARHGESKSNLTRTFLKPNEDSLTQMGILQSQLLGKHLSEENLTRIYSSDFIRAFDTANSILINSKNADKIKVKIDTRIRERNFGVFEEKSYKEAIEALVKSGEHILSYKPPNGESLAEVASRLKNFFDELCLELDKSEENSEIVVVVSHSFALIKLLESLANSPEKYSLINWDHQRNFKLLRNAAFFKLSVQRIVNEEGEEVKTERTSGDPGENNEIKRKIEFLELHSTTHLNSIESNDTLVNFTKTSEEAKAFAGCINS